MLDLAKARGAAQTGCWAPPRRWAMMHYHLGDLRTAHEYLSEALAYPGTPESMAHQANRIEALLVACRSALDAGLRGSFS